MGILFLLAVLAAPALIVWVITRGRGAPPSTSENNELHPDFGPRQSLPLGEQELGRRLTQSEKRH